MRYRSKTDAWLIVVLLGAAALLFAAAAGVLPGVPGVGGLLLAAFLVASGLFTLSYLWPGASYRLGDGVLEVRCGFFYRLRVPLDAVEHIRPTTTDWTAAPATSLDRLRVDYRVDGKRRHVLISPVPREDFLEQLRRRTPSLRRGE